jgi:hypothetical protein
MIHPREGDDEGRRRGVFLDAKMNVARGFTPRTRNRCSAMAEDTLFGDPGRPETEKLDWIYLIKGDEVYKINSYNDVLKLVR